MGTNQSLSKGDQEQTKMERCNRTAEVVSSNLIGSTNQNKRLDLD